MSVPKRQAHSLCVGALNIERAVIREACQCREIMAIDELTADNGRNLQNEIRGLSGNEPLAGAEV